MYRTDEKKPAGSSNSTAGGTDEGIVPEAPSTCNAFAAVVALFTLTALTYNNPANGTGMYIAANWAVNQALPDLTTAMQYLVKMGGV